MGIKKELKTAIICGGVVEDLTWLAAQINQIDVIIAADSGYDYCQRLGISPNIVIGDFDSVCTPVDENTSKRVLPVRKDVTDFEASLEYCRENDLCDITVFGAWGGRAGHSLGAVLSAFKYFKLGLEVKLKTEHNSMLFVKKYAVIPKNEGYASIFTLSSEPAVITLKGFDYLLDKYPLRSLDTLGISNKIISDFGEITLKSGIVLVILED